MMSYPQSSPPESLPFFPPAYSASSESGSVVAFVERGSAFVAQALAASSLHSLPVPPKRQSDRPS